MTDLVNLTEIGSRRDAYLHEIEENFLAGRHTWIVTQIHRVQFPEADLFEIDSANLVIWEPPHCAMCGSHYRDAPERCTS